MNSYLGAWCNIRSGLVGPSSAGRVQRGVSELTRTRKHRRKTSAIVRLYASILFDSTNDRVALDWPTSKTNEGQWTSWTP